MGMDWVALSAPWLEAEDEIEAAHQPVLQALMHRAGLKTGQSVLDIGCGMGASLIRAADAVGPQGQVLGLDIAPPMVERAAARVGAQVSVQVGDAETYGFEPGACDAVVSLFGLMFFADPQAAFVNIRKALRPGGRMTFASWATPKANPWFGIGGKIAMQQLGDLPATDPTAPGPFAFADEQRVLQLMEAAGWNADVETIDLFLTPKGGAADVANLQMKLGAAAWVMNEKQADASQAAAIRSALETAFAQLAEDGEVRVPAKIHIFSAVA